MTAERTPRYEPMLATPWPEVFDDPDWWFEVKWDGVRVLVEVDAGGVRLRSRSGRDVTDTYPELTGFDFDRVTVVDGEIVALDRDGRPSFSLLQQRINRQGLVPDVPVQLIAFDLLHHGEALISRGLEERRDRLAEILPSWVVCSDAVRGEGKALFAAVVDRNMEGTMAKRSGSAYRPGRRSPDWRKIVHRRSVKAVVGGFTLGRGARAETFGALQLGLWDEGRLRWIGAVGSGFSDRDLVAVRAALDALATERSPFHPPAPPATAFVEPLLVAAVEYRQWTTDGKLRAPSFKGFVDDPSETASWASEGPHTGPDTQ